MGRHLFYCIVFLSSSLNIITYGKCVHLEFVFDNPDYVGFLERGGPTAQHRTALLSQAQEQVLGVDGQQGDGGYCGRKTSIEDPDQSNITLHLNPNFSEIRICTQNMDPC